MNFIFPHSWLKDFLKTSASPQKIAECLSLCSASVEKITKVNNDWLYEVEIPSNRVDMMSVAGIAREAAAVLPEFGFKAKFQNDPYKLKNSNPFKPQTSNAELKVILKDKSLCWRFSAIIIKNVNLKPSPKIIKERLEKSGIRSLNNVVDISNYLMMAYGQPVHIFDYDKIAGHQMKLRRSQKGESLTTLDGKTFKLPGNDIVIEDKEGKLIDLCGIMGALNSAVSQKTKNILLFVQTYNPTHIRQTSMKLAQRTQASQLFEKGTDPQLVMPTLIKGIELISKLAQGKPAAKFYDFYLQAYKTSWLKFSYSLIEQILGIKILPAKVTKILLALGFQVEFSSRNQLLKVGVPSWRANDIKIPEDIVEEVARIWGYYRLPSQLPAGNLPPPSPWQKTFKLESKVKNLLKGWGFTEVYTYSLVSSTLLAKFNEEAAKHLALKNPLTADWQYLRSSLIPSLLEVLVKNQHLEKLLKIFEIANAYQPRKDNLPLEKSLLTLVLHNADFFQLKGLLEALFADLKINYDFKPELEHRWLVKEKTLTVFAGSEKLGIFGQLKPTFLKRMDLKGEVYSAELALDKFLKVMGKSLYRPINQNPLIIEDLTFIFPLKTYYAQIAALIKQLSPLLVKIDLVSQFQNRKTFRLYYQHPAKSLTSTEIAKIRKTIVNTLASKGIQLVGKV